MFDATTLAPLRTFGAVGPRCAVRGLAVTPDMRFLYTGSFDNMIRKWDILTGTLSFGFDAHTGSVQSLAVDGTGALWSSSFDGYVKQWALVETGEPQPGTLTPTAVESLSRIRAHQGTITQIISAVDGTIYTVGADSKVRRWLRKNEMSQPPPSQPPPMRMQDNATGSVMWTGGASPTPGPMAPGSGPVLRSPFDDDVPSSFASPAELLDQFQGPPVVNTVSDASFPSVPDAAAQQAAMDSL